MKHRQLLFCWIILMMVCFVLPVEAQETLSEGAASETAAPTESAEASAEPTAEVTEELPDLPVLDASALKVGSPFTLTIDISADQQASFTGAQSSLSAQLCPLGKVEECQELTLELDDGDTPEQSGKLSVAALPYGGNYRLDITYQDASGTFDEKQVSYLLKGVQGPAEPSATIAATLPSTPTIAATFTTTPTITLTLTPTATAELTLSPTVTLEMTPEGTATEGVPIERTLLYHQAGISDSRGTLMCSDTVPCGLLNGDDVFTLSYSLPAAWAASPLADATVPDVLGETTVIWPQDWADAARNALSAGLLPEGAVPCQIDADNRSRFSFEFVPGTTYYTASCQFALDGNLNGMAEMLSIHNENRYFLLNDLSISLPATLVKREVTLTPSLTLQMSADEQGLEQIAGGSVGRLYRAPDGTDLALYTLSASVSGIPAGRTPQAGDSILVSWDLLNKLNEMGQLPSCLIPHDAGVYELGSLVVNGDGSWGSSCSLRFPSALDEMTASGGMTLQFASSSYSTTANVSLSSLPFSKETLNINLSVPARMRLFQDYTINAQLSGLDGSLSDYARALLAVSGGGTLSSSWEYNALSSCGGFYQLDENGAASCSVRFDAPTDADSLMSFSFSAPGTENLLTTNLLPAADFTIPAVTQTQAVLTIELSHAGTAEALPAPAEAEYTVLDSYQLRFRLVPDAGFEDAAEALSLDGEGTVLDWNQPLTLQWALLPGGSLGLNFVRDGNAFEAHYDFQFTQGDADLSGALSQLYTSVNIPGWEVRLEPADQPLQLPARVSKQAARLYFGDMYRASDGQPPAAILSGEEMRIDLHFEGNLDTFDTTLLQVTSQQDGFDTAIPCEPVPGENRLTCTLIPLCSDAGETDYPVVCSGDNTLNASYAGDAVNNAAQAETKTWHVERSKLVFEIPQDGNLDASAMTSIEAATEDMGSMGYGSVSAGSWNVDSYLVRETRDSGGQSLKSYPVRFTWQVDGAAVEPLAENFLLDVTIESGSGDSVSEETISIHPQAFSTGTVDFALNFDSTEILADGRMVRDVLAKAMTIKKLSVRYTGDPLIAAGSRDYEREGLTFALKVATEIQTELDTSVEGELRFGGILSSETLLQPFRVYCSQLGMPLNCYDQNPLTYQPDLSAYADENGDGLDDLSGEAIPPAALPEEGCWGKISTLEGASPLIYVSALNAPQCYLTALHEGTQIWIGKN